MAMGRPKKSSPGGGVLDRAIPLFSNTELQQKPNGFITVLWLDAALLASFSRDNGFPCGG